jgi:hypothetical protein
MTDTLHCLDLFCGLGGFSQAFADADRWQVTTVDIEAEFAPDIQADVLELRPSDFDVEYDVVLASPPCKEFSPAQNLNGAHTPAGDAVALAFHTVGLIRGLDPQFWLLENPRGQLRSFLGRPTATVTYCQYGEAHMKPTDLWGEHPAGFIGRSCGYGDDCHINHHSGSNAMRDDVGKRSDAERAKVPRALSEAIREAVEAAIDDPPPTQAELPVEVHSDD